MNPRILAIQFPTSPSATSLPELAALLLRISPRIGIRPPDMLYVDVRPTLHLFGGEKGVVDRVRAFLETKGCRYRLALADDAATAGALARAGRERVTRAEPGTGGAALAPLPIGLLRFLANPLSRPEPEEERTAEDLIRMLPLLGIRTLGGFARLPASTIGSRFGSVGVDLHRRARSEAVTPIDPFEPVKTYRESREFEEPLGSVEPLLFAAKELLHRLEEAMKKDSSSALEMNVRIETETAEETRLAIPLHRPLRREGALLPILRERLSVLSLEAPVVALSIEVTLPVRTRGGQFHLFDAHEERSERLSELLGRLVGKLGPTVVTAASLRERHRPEGAFGETPFEPGPAPEKRERPLPFAPSRPTHLLPAPRPLDLSRLAVAAIAGPERLAGEWWEPAPFARDYFVAETKSGQRLWLFRRLADRKVFLHGYFD
jgi:protein ImuB